ncbi:Hsp70 family protein [Marinovum sp. SP66]|uniref:Hsp70 family protein n=1 Tax=Marinovum TaxID=367771 RepID=UPI00237A50D1|nr:MULTISPECIES: Hsp70 family protein [Marinovum]MDD9741275.1 Hsp70 family protein [Marinovum sp. SP66]
MARLGIDFGTSNTGAGILRDGRPAALPLEAGAQTLPTAVFVDFTDKRFVYGEAAARAMMEGQDGRFMRGLKSILGTPLAREKRRFLNERMTLIEVIGRFLAEIRCRSERITGQSFEAAISGRPVRFHSESEDKDAQAEIDLREAYALAGFRAVDFLPEPEAAALAVAGEGRMLIVDIGGGTSDFTLCERARGQTRVIASRGLRLGGTDFDRSLSLAHVMPLLGHGAEIGAELGAKTHAAPRALFHDLASWEKIAFVYDAALLREVKRWIRLARDPVLFERLAEVLEMHLGHDIAYAVEAGKIAANDAERGEIALDVVQRGLRIDLWGVQLQHELSSAAARIGDMALATLKDGGCRPDQVDMVVFVGGSSQLSGVRQALARRLPEARQETAEVFTAVVHGLAFAAR